MSWSTLGYLLMCLVGLCIVGLGVFGLIFYYRWTMADLAKSERRLQLEIDAAARSRSAATALDELAGRVSHLRTELERVQDAANLALAHSDEAVEAAKAAEKMAGELAARVLVVENRTAADEVSLPPTRGPFVPGMRRG